MFSIAIVTGGASGVAGRALSKVSSLASDPRAADVRHGARRALACLYDCNPVPVRVCAVVVVLLLLIIFIGYNMKDADESLSFFNYPITKYINFTKHYKI